MKLYIIITAASSFPMSLQKQGRFELLSGYQCIGFRGEPTLFPGVNKSYVVATTDL